MSSELQEVGAGSGVCSELEEETGFRHLLSSAVSSRHPLDKGLPSHHDPDSRISLWRRLGHWRVLQLRTVFSPIGHPRASADRTEAWGCEEVSWPVPLACVCRRVFCGQFSLAANDRWWELLRQILATNISPRKAGLPSPALRAARTLSLVPLCTCLPAPAARLWRNFLPCE